MHFGILTSYFNSNSIPSSIIICTEKNSTHCPFQANYFSTLTFNFHSIAEGISCQNNSNRNGLFQINWLFSIANVTASFALSWFKKMIFWHFVWDIPPDRVSLNWLFNNVWISISKRCILLQWMESSMEIVQFNRLFSIKSFGSNQFNNWISKSPIDYCTENDFTRDILHSFYILSILFYVSVSN